VKPFLFTTLIAGAYAEEEEGAMTKLKNWFSDEQEHVFFDSIKTADPYTLSGKYGGYQKFGIDFAFISQTVGGA